MNPRRREAFAPLSFVFIDTHPARVAPRLAEARQRFDLASAVRLVARRHLPRFQNAGRVLGCRPGRALPGRWRRRWLDRTTSAVLSLVARLIPEAPVTVDIRRAGREAVVEASCPAVDGPVRGQRNPGLARLTRARDEWLLDFWFWRAVARSGGGRLALVHDELGPIGIRLFLRV